MSDKNAWIIAQTMTRMSYLYLKILSIDNITVTKVCGTPAFSEMFKRKTHFVATLLRGPSKKGSTLEGKNLFPKEQTLPLWS